MTMDQATLPYPFMVIKVSKLVNNKSMENTTPRK
jgi:hypothetical protein